jgi:hypothetical protein
MRKLILTAVIFLFGISAEAQTSQPVFNVNPFPKTITVSGSADMEVVPDEIFVNVELKEYQKKGEDKKVIEKIKLQFLESCKAIGIPDSNISIVSYTGINPYYWKRKKKDPDLLAGIIYQVKFKSIELMDKLVEKLDDEATQNFRIASVSHSKINEFRKQLKIQAVKAAKEKAIYLAEAIGEKATEAITIHEPNEPFVDGYLSGRVMGLAAASNYQQSGINYKPEDDLQEVEFKKIKLRYEVEVVFALK